jgi:hypothetical protein
MERSYFGSWHYQTMCVVNTTESAKPNFCIKAWWLRKAALAERIHSSVNVDEEYPCTGMARWMRLDIDNRRTSSDISFDLMAV